MGNIFCCYRRLVKLKMQSCNEQNIHQTLRAHFKASLVEILRRLDCFQSKTLGEEFDTIWEG